MADEPRRRGRGAEAQARSEALERLKALRSGGRRSELQIKVETPIYDTVDEDEYESLVAKRREETRGFIVDDDGLGYGDEGEEEDWTKDGLPPSSDESDGERDRPRKKKQSEKKDKEGNSHPNKKPKSSLTAAAAMMGKQRLSNMFTSSVFKKNKDEKGKGLSDSIVDDVIAEFAPDEEDRERRRKVQSSLSSATRIYVPVANVKREYNGFSGVNDFSKTDMASENGASDMSGNGVWDVGADTRDQQHPVEESENGHSLKSEVAEESNVNSDDLSMAKEVKEEKKLSTVEVKVEPAVKEEVHNLNAKITDKEDPSLSATAGWQAVRNSGNGDVSSVKEIKSEEKTDFELSPDGSLPFYILDAHEEIYGANMGTLYLFGKVTHYSSCHHHDWM